MTFVTSWQLMPRLLHFQNKSFQTTGIFHSCQNFLLPEEVSVSSIFLPLFLRVIIHLVHLLPDTQMCCIAARWLNCKWSGLVLTQVEMSIMHIKHYYWSLVTWWARHIRSRSCLCRNLATTSAPNVKDTPRSFSPQPMVSLSGSDQRRSHSRPWSGTSVGLMMRRICSMDCRSGLKPKHKEENTCVIELWAQQNWSPCLFLNASSRTYTRGLSPHNRCFNVTKCSNGSFTKQPSVSTLHWHTQRQWVRGMGWWCLPKY